MIYVTAAVFYAFMALVVWDDTSKENVDRPWWLGPAPSPALRGVFWFPIMLVALVQVAEELIREAGSVIRPRR